MKIKYAAQFHSDPLRRCFVYWPEQWVEEGQEFLQRMVRVTPEALHDLLDDLDSPETMGTLALAMDYGRRSAEAWERVVHELQAKCEVKGWKLELRDDDLVLDKCERED